MPWWLAEGAVYRITTFFFATRFSESVEKWTGMYDVLGGSHQIFHVLVVGASMLHRWSA